MTLHNMHSILLQIPKLRLEVPKCSAPRRDPLSILNISISHFKTTGNGNIFTLLIFHAISPG